MKFKPFQRLVDAVGNARYGAAFSHAVAAFELHGFMLGSRLATPRQPLEFEPVERDAHTVVFVVEHLEGDDVGDPGHDAEAGIDAAAPAAHIARSVLRMEGKHARRGPYAEVVEDRALDFILGRLGGGAGSDTGTL